MSKIGMRRAWFQVHKWIGLILAIAIIPISFTGAALVWHDGLEEMLHPQRYATSGKTVLEPARYISAAQSQLQPGERIVQLTLPSDGSPVVAAAAQAGKVARGGPPPRTSVYLDPPSAAVLDVDRAGGGIVRAMHVIHGSLMIPGGWGRSIVGWIGVAMALSCFTGIWLWWPTIGKWARGLRWRRHPNLDTNLHHTLGFWIALPLFVLSFTGAWISFPAFVNSFGAQAPRPKGPPGPDRAAMMRARPLANPRLTIDAAVAAAQAKQPGSVTQIGWPTDVKAAWSVGIKAEGRPTTYEIADADGSVKTAPPRTQSPTARLMRQIHDGTDMGPVWQVIIFVGGLVPVVLAITGVIMWWRARGWKRKLARRQRAKLAVLRA